MDNENDNAKKEEVVLVEPENVDRHELFENDPRDIAELCAWIQRAQIKQEQAIKGIHFAIKEIRIEQKNLLLKVGSMDNAF